MSALVKALSLYCLAALLGAYALAFWFDAPKPIVAQTFLILSLTAIVTCVALVFLGYVIRLAAVEREPFPIARIGADCARFLRPSYLIDRLGPLALSFFLLAAFGTYKSLITKIQPFYLDGFLSGPRPQPSRHRRMAPNSRRVREFWDHNTRIRTGYGSRSFRCR